ncbi:MAG: RNA polymerase factor sigma-32 [Proteobacteria bacterium]|nr:RNA polymerase factor sigma-32 [Pseudomonadota bacterium]
MEKTTKKKPSTALVIRDSTDLYFKDLKKLPVLSAEEEKKLAMQWFETRDREAGQKLVLSNLRFVVKIAKEYSKYGFKMQDLIQEGNLGLMHAVDKYDPRKGYRLITYAVWWIRAYIQSHILRSWSIVRTGTTRVQRRIFNGLQKAMRRISGYNSSEPVSNKLLAKELDVTEAQLSETMGLMKRRDVSMDQSLSGGQFDNITFGDTLSDPNASVEDKIIEQDMQEHVRGFLDDIYDELTPRERYMLEHRILAETPMTLEEIGAEFGITRERVRQLENRMKEKLRKAFEEKSGTKKITPEIH